MKLWNRLDRYVDGGLRGPFFLGLSAFTLVLLLNFLFIFAQHTIEKNVPMRLILGFLLARFPYLLQMALPMAALLAVLVALGRLSSEGELLALRAAGISLPRIYRPVFVISLLLMVNALLVTHYLQPIGRQYEKDLVKEIWRAQDFSKEIDPGVFYSRLPGAVFYAEKALNSPEGRVFEGILLFQESTRQNESDLIVARRGQGDFDGETGRVTLRLDEVEWHAYNPDKPETYTVIKDPYLTLSFPPAASFRAFTSETSDNVFQPKHFVASALLKQIHQIERDLEKTNAEALVERAKGRENALAGAVMGLESRLRKFRQEWYRRWAFPVAIPVLMFAAFPMAARTRRGGRFTGLAQALGVIFVFWLSLSFGEGLADSRRLPIAVGAWLPHGVVLTWGTILWVVLLRDREQRRSLFMMATAAVSGLIGRRRETGTAPNLARVDRWGGLTRLDSYLSKSLMRMLGASVLTLLSLFAAVKFKDAIEAVDSATTSFPWADALTYVGMSVPGDLQFLLPVAGLFAVMISLSGFARTGEIVAMKSCGIGPWRIALPLLVAMLGVSALYAAAQETVIPAAARQAEEARGRLRGRPVVENRQSGRRWIVGESGHFWSYMGWDSEREELLLPEILVVDLKAGRVLERISAEASYHQEEGWHFTEAWRRRFFPGTPPLYDARSDFDEGFREDPEVFGLTRGASAFKHNLADQMSFRDLLSHVRRFSRAGYNAAPLLVGLHLKVVNPLLPVLLAFVGIPLIVGKQGRRSGFYGFGMGLAISFAFYVLLAVSQSLGRQELLSPIVAAWVAPVVLALTSVFLLLRSK